MNITDILKNIDTKGVAFDGELIEQLSDMAERKGYSLEEAIQKYIYSRTEGRKIIAEWKMSPSLAGLVGILGDVPDDYDWRKDVEEELYEKYKIN